MPVKLVNRGSALISALFIMTLVAIAATAMSTRLQLDIYRTRLTITSDELYLASQAVSFWAMDMLSTEQKRFTINRGQGKLMNFPTSLQQIYPNVTINGSLYDLQARFNLNNLQDKKFHPLFFRLLENTFPKTDNVLQRSLIDAIYHWISPYQPGRGHESHIGLYLKKYPPYLPSYQPMQSISELRMINGVNNAVYQKLLPNSTVLPEVTQININTASSLLLMSLGNGLNETQLKELLEARGKKGFTELKDLHPLLQKLNIPNDQVTIESTYFLSIATVTSKDLNLTTYTIIKRGRDQRRRLSVGIVSESLNTM